MAHLVAGWLALVAWATLAFAGFERLRPRHRHHPRARRIGGAAVLLGANVAIAHLLARVIDLQGGRVVLGWLVGEVLLYAQHRAMHRVPLLWRYHRLHHDDVPLAWTTTWYTHPIDATLETLCGIVAALLVGGGMPSALWFVVGRRVWAIVLHANIAWPASGLDRLIATPAFHARHHREELPAANFASTLPALDWLLGTRAA